MSYEVEPTAYWSILDALTGIILHYRRGSVVEIGTDIGGGSTGVLEKHAARYEVNFYTCDINPLRVPKLEYKNHHHSLMSSFDFMKQGLALIEAAPPAVVLLDGSHDAIIVIEEVKFFFKHLLVGGVIFIHDTLPPVEEYIGHHRCGNVYHVRQDLATWHEKADCLSWPYAATNCGLTMVLKREIDPPYYRR